MRWQNKRKAEKKATRDAAAVATRVAKTTPKVIRKTGTVDAKDKVEKLKVKVNLAFKCGLFDLGPDGNLILLDKPNTALVSQIAVHTSHHTRITPPVAFGAANPGIQASADLIEEPGAPSTYSGDRPLFDSPSPFDSLGPNTPQDLPDVPESGFHNFHDCSIDSGPFKSAGDHYMPVENAYKPTGNAFNLTGNAYNSIGNAYKPTGTASQLTGNASPVVPVAGMGQPASDLYDTVEHGFLATPEDFDAIVNSINAQLASYSDEDFEGFEGFKLPQ